MFALNYITYRDKSFLHFYHTASEGLCLKEKRKGRWSDTFHLCYEAKKGFCAYCDSDGVIHILCTDDDGKIIYIKEKNLEWNQYILSEGNNEIIPVSFRIVKAGNIMNFFYSARYNASMILVHCVLGDNAMPERIDALDTKHPEFCICDNKVYYTNENNVLGYRDFSDSKPGVFVELEKDAYFGYVTKVEGKEFLVYKKDNFLYVNHDRTYLDEKAMMPLLCQKDNKITLQWQSGNFVRYLTSFNGGVTWSSPMRFINNGVGICRFFIQTEDRCEYSYGQNLRTEPVVYGKSNLFFSEVPVIRRPMAIGVEEKASDEYKKMQILIDLQKREIKTLKSKIKELEKS